MAFSVTTDSISQSPGSVTFFGSYNGAGPFDEYAEVRFDWGYVAFNFQTPGQEITGTNSGSFNANESVTKDRAAKVKAKGFAWENINVQGTSINFKTYADSPAFTGLIPGTPTTTTCPVSGSIVPNTNESTGLITLEYRQQGTSTWFTHSTVASGISGTGSIGLGGTLSGLAPGTVYEARYKITRNTENVTVAYSNVGTFTTQSSTALIIGVPVIECLAEMLTPTYGGGAVIIDAPLIEVQAEFLPPTFNVPNATVKEVLVQLCDILERTVVMDI